MRRLEKQQAIKLRLQGKSYNEIRKLLQIPSKGTLSYWFKNLSLPPLARKRLARNMALAQERGLLKFNRDRSKIILRENRREIEFGSSEIGKLSRRELLLVGAALYWGEGTKSNGNSPAVVLVNSDPRLVALFMRFIREILMVSEDKIKSAIHVHHNVNIEGAKRF